MARILHIGARPEESERLRRLLAAEGHEVTTARDARDGIERALALRPQLVVIEFDETGSDGFETATRLRSFAELEQTAILALVNEGDRELALSVGCDACMERPVDEARLVRRIRSVLGGRRERVRSHVQRRLLETYSRTLVGRLEAKVAELTEANARLRATDELKNRVLENFSRQLATPLTPLIGYLALLGSGRLGPLNPRQRRAVYGVEHSVRRLASTVDRLLDLASLEDVGLGLQWERVDAGEVARSAVRAVQEKSRGRRIEVRLLAPEGPVTVRADRARLEQALILMLDNALRFSPRGGYVLIEVRARDGRVRYAVYDSGAPIPADQQGRAFEPFANGARPSPDSAVRPDLELTLVRRIAQSLGGMVAVESPPRAYPESEHDYPGAKFTLDLPLADEENAS